MSNQSSMASELNEVKTDDKGTALKTTNDTVSTPSTQTLVSSTHGQRPTAMQKNVAPFLNKVYNMVNDPSSDDLIRWASDGKSFFVVRHEDFARSVLPRFFKHSNFSSFVRQLNMYGFHKVPHLQHGVLHSDNDSEQWEFSNPHFQRNQPDLLLLVTRKKGRENEEKESTAATANTSNNNSVTNIDLQHILEEIQVIKQHQMNISSQLKNIQNDNSILWQETISARERHQRHQETIDKILRFLASVFSNDKSMAIPRKRRYLLEAPDSDIKDQQNIEYQRYGNNLDVNTNNERPTKVQKAMGTPEFNLEDYVPGLQNYTGTPPISTPPSTSLPNSSLKYKASSNPTSELDDAIALNDKSKQSSAVSSLRSPMSLPQDLTQVMSIQQIQGLQSLIGLAQSNPALLSQLTSDVFNNYHQNNPATNSIPASATPATVPTPEYSPFNQSFDPSLLGTPNNAIATIPPSLYSAPSYNSSQQPSNASFGIYNPNANRVSDTGNDQRSNTPTSIQPRPMSDTGSPSTSASDSITKSIAPDNGFTPSSQQTASPFTPSTTITASTTPAKSPSTTDSPSLPQISSDIQGLTRTADDINSDIDTLGSNIEALAQQLGFDPTKTTNDDILGYVDMDKFLQAYGPGDDSTIYPSETISPAATTPVSPSTQNSGNNV
ncbi:hypothetical protein BCR42DRAFT_448288 [Absidia repens]|uniref:HSF-type DNA-binding domain-containing protein n=1 Tax=Absidia repens TaxID=90262 RepID=A0A1X2ISC8_9FUNG|nr:hypothetical protein BCR42DRAFT_448288 [Absidia repens]